MNTATSIAELLKATGGVNATSIKLPDAKRTDTATVWEQWTEAFQPFTVFEGKDSEFLAYPIHVDGVPCTFVTISYLQGGFEGSALVAGHYGYNLSYQEALREAAELWLRDASYYDYDYDHPIVEVLHNTNFLNDEAVNHSLEQMAINA